MRPVAIVFANLKGNLGDFAILHAMLLDLATRFPNRALHVYSHPFHSVDAERLAAFRKTAPSFELRGKTPTIEVGLVPRLLGKLRRREVSQEREIAYFRKTNELYFRQFSDYEAIYFAGGDQWSGRELGICMLGSLLAISEAKPGIIGTYPFSLKASIRKTYSPGYLASVFSHFNQPILARDTETYHLLRNLGVEARSTVDSVYLLSDLASNIKPQQDRDARRVLLVVKSEPRSISDVARRLIKNGVRIELITSCEPEDGSAYREIAKALSLNYHAPVTWQDVVSEMMSSQLIVTNRLHGLILASFAGVPIFPVCNRAKARAFSSDAAIDSKVNHLSELSAPAIFDAIARSEELINRVQLYRDASRRSIEEALVK
jgi:polysaccharide pyruvyl transferase WcaK-like protein